MKLFRYRANGAIRPGLFREGSYFDLDGLDIDFNGAFFAANGLEKLREAISRERELPLIRAIPELAAPVQKPSKIICVGLNYIDHAKESKLDIPKEPVLFLKATNAFSGPNDPVMIPPGSVKTDWEVELAVVIRKRASYVEAHEAFDYAAGYCLMNDVSEREYQLERNGTWDKGKGCDSFAPCGPFLVTPDEIKDLKNIKIWLKLNGNLMQSGNTSDLIFPVNYLISYISRFMTLEAGDIISTGTPPGVGMGRSPQVYLKEGDVMEMGSDELGIAAQKLVAFGKYLNINNNN